MTIEKEIQKAELRLKVLRNIELLRKLNNLEVRKLNLPEATFFSDGCQSMAKALEGYAAAPRCYEQDYFEDIKTKAKQRTLSELEYNSFIRALNRPEEVWALGMQIDYEKRPYLYPGGKIK